MLIESPPRKKGRKPISIPSVFEKRDYITVLFFIYKLRMAGIQQKRKWLDIALVKNADSIYNMSLFPIIHEIAFFLNSIIFADMYRNYLKGYVTNSELEAFEKKNSLEDFLDHRFLKKGDLSKRLKYLVKLGLVQHRYDTGRGTFWDISEQGIYEIEKWHFSFSLAHLIQYHPELYKERKDEISKLLSLSNPLYSKIDEEILKLLKS